MPSIFDIPIQEYGGPTAQKGFEYQHRIGVGELLLMALNPKRDLVEFDSHDDILVRLNHSEGVIAEFVQVKFRHSGSWKPFDLYSDGKAGVPAAQKHFHSIISKQLRRAIGDDTVNFRIVSNSDVNQDLAVLKQPPERRKAASGNALKSKLLSRFSHLRFPGDRSVGDWIDRALWEVAGQERAVDDKNLRLISEAVFLATHRTLTPAQVQEIYQHLLTRVRQASAISESKDGKSCTRHQILSWLDCICTKLPVHLSPTTQKLVDNLQKEARQRCVGRWMATGISAHQAERFARDDSLGSFAAAWIREQEENFLWISAQFGAGKSLAVDRIYQEALNNYQCGQLSKIPVFLPAKILTRPLTEEIDRVAQMIGNHQRDGVFAIIDGADERSPQSARELIHEAANYSRAHPESRIIVTSSVLDVTGYQSKQLPPLPKKEARYLLDLIAGRQEFHFDPLGGRFSSDLEIPLFIILCGQFGLGLSKAELVNKMVTSALQRIESDVTPVESLLTRLACWQLDNGSGVIPERILGLSLHATPSLLKTKLIERQGTSYSFAIECVAQWFAAQAITTGQVSVAKMTNDPKLLDRWQFAISIALSQASGDEVDAILRPLAENQPAFASLILADGLKAWQPNQTEGRATSEEVKFQIGQTMAAWKSGLEPISGLPNVFPVDDLGNFLKLSATSKGGRFDVVWSEKEGAQLPDFNEPDARFDGRVIYWGGVIIDHSAWAWKSTHSHIQYALKKIVHDCFFVDSSPRLRLESAWADGCRVLNKSQLYCQQLPASELAMGAAYNFLPYKRAEALTQVVTELLRNQNPYFEAPYPQADQRPTGKTFDGFFSFEQAVKRAVAVYSVALVAYREVVEALFPKMAVRFPRYAAHPFNLRGIIYRLAGSGSEVGGYVLSSFMEAASQDCSAQAYFVAGTKDEADQTRDHWVAEARSANSDHAGWHLRSWGGSLLMLGDQQPAMAIVKGWLERDLKAVGWI